MPEIEWSNVGASNPLAAGPNPIILRASIEYPARTFTPITWGHGLRDVTIDPGVTVRSWPVPITIPPHTEYVIHQFVTVPIGGRWVTSVYRGSGPCFASPGVDRTMGGGGPYTDRNAIVAFGPSNIFGRPNSTTMVVNGISLPVTSTLVLGDSISVGTGDGIATGEGISPPYGTRGFIARSLFGLGLPFINNGRGGNRISIDGNLANSWRRLAPLDQCRVVLCNLGTNDSGGSLAAFQNSYASLNRVVVSSGGKLIPCTLGPRTNATNDGPLRNDTTNREFIDVANAWLRTNPFGNGYFDHSAAVCDPSDQTRWNPSFAVPASFDGLHPMPDAHRASAAALSAKIANFIM
ncbi:SGNH/GDSL hydrolase family protein [Roseomonas haemaphysalidis]|uniref:SGNH/GDSL hydrolase family protein n=2 Tax=Roseomonas haemaphysalidis TaxID=2768162 RepID=UPI003AF4A63B